jgi:hypothetical protein
MATTLDDLDLEDIASSVYPKVLEEDFSFSSDTNISDLSRLAGFTLSNERITLKLSHSAMVVQFTCA